MKNNNNKISSHIKISYAQIIDLTEEEDIDPFLYIYPTENQIMIKKVLISYEQDIKDNDLEVNNISIKLKREDFLAFFSILMPIEGNVPIFMIQPIILLIILILSK